MSQKVIIDVQANTATATANIEETTDALNKLTQSQEDLDNANNQTASSFEDVTKNGGAIAILDQLTGGLASRIRDSYEASKLFNFSLKGMRTALIATGIGAFVVALVAVVAYWDDIVESISGANAKLQKGIQLQQEYIGTFEDELALINARQEFSEVQLGFDRQIHFEKMAKLREIAKERKKLDEKLFKDLERKRHGEIEAYEEAHAAYQANKLAIIRGNIEQAEAYKKLGEVTVAEREREEAAANELLEKRKKIQREALELEEELRLASINTQKEIREEELYQVELQYEDLLQKARNYYGEDSEQFLELLTTKQEKKVALETRFAEEDEARRKEKEAEDERIRLEKEAKEQAEKDAKDKAELERLKKLADDKKKIEEDALQFEKNKNEAIATSKANMQNILTQLEESGLKKSKAGQAIYKAIALTQIGLDSAIAISKASTLANAEGTAAQLAFPLVPGIGTIARVLSYASTAAQVGANISRAKQLLSGGGAAAAVGGIQSSRPQQISGAAQSPAFNIVGQGGASQIATALGEQQQQPVQAYVVSQDITTAQSLENGIIQGATLGG
jgi:hypothetical protein